MLSAETIRNLEGMNQELVKSIVELKFRLAYNEFLKDGEPRVLYHGEFFENPFPLSLVYEQDDAQTIFPYEEMRTVFQGVFRNDMQRDIADYPTYAGETTLTESPNMPSKLSTYVGKRIKTETVSYFLKSRGDGKLRKIERVRYLDLDSNSPIAEKWEGKSWDAFGINPSGEPGAKTTISITPSKQLTPIPVLV